MHKAMTIAKYVINHSNGINRPISNLKLQKVLYYIQAAFLVEFGKVCFKEKILAWDYGPVIREVYDEFKVYGREAIPEQNQTKSLVFDHSKVQIVCQKEAFSLKQEEKSIIDKVIQAYSPIDNPFELVEKTHEEDPWKNAHKSQRGCEISTDSIEAYYKEHREKIYNR